MVIVEVKEEKVDVKPIVIYIIGANVLSFIIAFIMGITIAKNASFEDYQEIVQNSALIYTSIIVNVILFVVFLILYHKRLKDDFKRLSKKDFKIILQYTLILLVLNYVISNLFTYFGVSMSNQELLSTSLVNDTLVMSIVAIIFAPFVEEFIFRYSLGTLINKKNLFIIVSGFVFGIFHGVEFSLVLYWMIGSFFALIYYNTNKNILASIIAHFINNLFAVVTLFLGI